MLPIDRPTREEFMALAHTLSPAAVSLYVETTPVTSDIGASRIAYENAVRAAMDQLAAVDLPRGAREALAEHLDDIAQDDDFWARQANTLAVLATPDGARTFRLANRVAPAVEVSDRFHLKPLLRALTFPHAAFVLALSQSAARLVAFCGDGRAEAVRVPGMPESAADAAGKASILGRQHARRIAGSEGRKVRLTQYARGVDAALRPVLAGSELPLVLAANPPLGPIFRSVSSYPHLLGEGLAEAVDRLSPAALAERARPLLDAAYAAEVAEVRALIAARQEAGRTTFDVATAARAAVAGAIETLLVDMDATVPGTLEETTGEIAFAAGPGPASYGIVDQIAVHALAAGARVLSVRADDLPADGPLAATLRYAF